MVKFIRQQWRMWIETSRATGCQPLALKFIRQQWRMWIETQFEVLQQNAQEKFIRQQWRMWIETNDVNCSGNCIDNSFASNGECGLKHRLAVVKLRGTLIHSPAMANVD